MGANVSMQNDGERPRIHLNAHGHSCIVYTLHETHVRKDIPCQILCRCLYLLFFLFTEVSPILTEQLHVTVLTSSKPSGWPVKKQYPPKWLSSCYKRITTTTDTDLTGCTLPRMNLLNIRRSNFSRLITSLPKTSCRWTAQSNSI